MAGNKRINKETQIMMRDNDLNKNQYSIELVNVSKQHLIAKILGPLDTLFQRGVFGIDMKIPDKYPFEPPICKFVTKVWHSNISSATGAICLDILKDKWAAGLKLESLILSLQSFLETPVPDDPQDAVVANRYKKCRPLYDKTAKYWTYTYAMSDDNRKTVDRNQFKDFEEKMKTFMSQTKAPRDKALTSLSCSHWDVNHTIRTYSV